MQELRIFSLCRRTLCGVSVLVSFALLAQLRGETSQDLPPISNCGLVAVLAVIEMMQKTASYEEVEKILRPSDINGRPTNFAEMKLALKANNIESVAVKFTDLQEFIETLQVGMPSIIQVNGGEMQHFVTVMATGNDFRIYDYPLSQKLSAGQLRTFLVENGVTGYALLTGNTVKTADKLASYSAPAEMEKKSEPAKVSADSDENYTIGKYLKVAKTLDALVPPTGVETLSVKLPVRNSGNEPLFISKITGSCSCFLGADKTDFVPPNSTRDVTLHFLAEHVRKSNAIVSIVLATSDPITPTSITSVTFSAKPLPGSLTILNNTCFIRAGSDDEKLRADFTFIDARREVDMSKFVTKLDYDKSKIGLVGIETGVLQFGDVHFKSVKLVFTVHKFLEGYYNLPIMVSTSDADYPTITLKICGIGKIQ